MTYLLTLILLRKVWNKIFAEKVTTPREGLSFRSGFNSSRRLYELSHINKQLNDSISNHYESKGKSKAHSISSSMFDNEHDNLFVADHEESKDKLTLKQKIEMKIKENQELTFENNKKDLFVNQNGK